MDFNIERYKKILGRNDSEHDLFYLHFSQIVHENCSELDTLRNVDVYNMLGDTTNPHAGNELRLIIYVNALNSEESDVIIKKDEEQVAEYDNQCNQLFIHHSFDEFNQENVDLFKFIMEEFNRLVIKPKLMENSWVHTQNKEGLTNRFVTNIKQQKERALRREKESVETYERRIHELKRDIKNYSDQLIQKRRFIENEEKNIENVSTKFLNDLDLIVQHDKIIDLHIKENKFVVYTNPLYIHSDKGSRYYGGKYRIEIAMDNADVRFFGDNPRRSYWTDHDPHPHVDGRSGEACLGNVASTIAELCSQNEIYALVLVCIDFLESANTADPAGRRVTNWDEVDKDGNIIPEEERTDLFTCSCCGEGRPIDQRWIVYEGTEEDENGDETPIGEHYVCTECREDSYVWDEDLEEYIAE